VNVVLIGLSGSGKSSVGEALARRLGWAFVDTDREVEREAGLRIHEIFVFEGEAGFRRRESDMLLRVLKGEQLVVSVGAGAVVDSANRACLASGNLVVLLEADVDTLLSRLKSDEESEPRPMLACDDPRERLLALKALRDPLYHAVAALRVSTEGKEVAGIVATIATQLDVATTASQVRTGEER